MKLSDLIEQCPLREQPPCEEKDTPVELPEGTKVYFEGYEYKVEKEKKL